MGTEAEAGAGWNEKGVTQAQRSDVAKMAAGRAVEKEAGDGKNSHAEMGIPLEPFQSSNELLSLLNKLGNEGWELVARLPESAATHGQIVAKRPKDKAWNRPASPSPPPALD